MSESDTAVGLNAEPDDFAARYDRMVQVGVGPLLTRFLVASLGAFVILGLLFALLRA